MSQKKNKKIKRQKIYQRLKKHVGTKILFSALICASCMHTLNTEAMAISTNAKDNIVSSMDATGGNYQSPAGQVLARNDRSLENIGSILNGTSYTIGGSTIHAGMFGYNTGNVDYIFNNIGTINIHGTDSIFGMYVNGTGSHVLKNSGTMTVNGADQVVGMSVVGKGDHRLTNSGALSVSGMGYAYGMYVLGDGNHVLINSNDMKVSGLTDSIYGMYVNGTGNHQFINTGSMDIKGQGSVYAMRAYGDGNHQLMNYGKIITTGTSDHIYGMSTEGDGNHQFVNTGSMDIKGQNSVYAMRAYGDGSHQLSNSGVINVNSTGNYSYGMSAENTGNHSIKNTGAIAVSGTDQVYGMYVHGNNTLSGSHLLSNTGMITTKASLGSAAEAYGNTDYSVDVWATTLRTWTPDDAVFGINLFATLNFKDTKLILRPGTATQGFAWGQEYNIGTQTNGMAAGVSSFSSITGTITNAVAEVPFIKAVLTGSDPNTATVRLEKNVTATTTPGMASQVMLKSALSRQMSKITRHILKDFYADVFSQMGMSSGSVTETPQENKWSVFMTPYVDFVNNSDMNFDGNSVGMTFGASYKVNEKFSLGAHFDFNASDINADIMDMSNKNTSYAAGLHAVYKIMPEWYISAQVTAALAQSDNEYSLTEFTPLSADALYNSEMLALSLNSGYVIKFNKNHSLTPEIGLSYLTMHSDAYDITWAGSIASGLGGLYDLSYDDSYFSAVYGSLNLTWRSQWDFENNTNLGFILSGGVRHNLSGTDVKSSVRALGDAYTFNYTEDATTWTVNGGVTFGKDDFSISLGYNGEYSTKQQVHGGNVMVKLEF